MSDDKSDLPTIVDVRRDSVNPHIVWVLYSDGSTICHDTTDVDSFGSSSISEDDPDHLFFDCVTGKQTSATGDNIYGRSGATDCYVFESAVHGGTSGPFLPSKLIPKEWPTDCKVRVTVERIDT